jgi:TRAP-type C4-dicarboxylate transport system permease small subunit
MMDTWFKIRLLHGVISFFLASLCALIGAAAVFFGSVYLFNRSYPHDAMNGLGAISLALPAGLVLWVILFLRSMQWLHARAWRKQEEARILAQAKYFRR